jgi:hypothetical protein
MLEYLVHQPGAEVLLSVHRQLRFLLAANHGQVAAAAAVRLNLPSSPYNLLFFGRPGRRRRAR